MAKLRKKITGLIILLLTAMMGFLSIPQKTVHAADNEVEVTLHYHRFFADYTGWSVWAWVGTKDGAQFEFNDEDAFGKIAKFNISTVGIDSKGIGFLIKDGNWAKDPDPDRFITLDKVENGKVEIFCVTRSTEIYYTLGEVDLSPRFLAASFINMKTISVSISKPITEVNKNQFTVQENGVDISGITVSRVSDMEARITLPSNASVTKNYKVFSTEAGNSNVSINGLFSTPEFESEFTYTGNDLGATYTASATNFRLWAPLASKVDLNLYQQGTGDNKIKTVSMVKADKGTWTHSESGNLDKVYYTYSVTNDNTYEVVDPYARAGGTNSERGMIVDLTKTNPTGFTTHSAPKQEKTTDAIIYETHVREFTIDSSSGVNEANRGKFLGLTQTGTKNAYGETTALDHLKELGITDLHLLPIFDYASVDESSNEPQFNWGYDPVNYNIPEGSYSSDPSKGEVRINELKETIKVLHENGIRVIMDVVYNHTSKSSDSYLNRIVPGYYYRMNGDGSFSNGSGCGNETASERSMFRKFMVDSVKYWVNEYKVDGFRFDLMGLHDITTMNKIHDELSAINPEILLYGEGWTGGTSTLPLNQQALKKNATQMPGIAVFSDDIRNSTRGGVFTASEQGFVQGVTSNGIKDSVKFGIVGSVSHGGVSLTPWATTPASTVTYISAHDNNTLWDKLNLSTPGSNKDNRIKMNKLAASIVLTSQGIPFFTAGEELLRTKPLPDGSGVSHNSYNLPDSTNAIKWDSKHEALGVFNYYKGLIALRKTFPMFTVTDSDYLLELSFFDDLDPSLIGYRYLYEEVKNGVKTKYDLVVYFNNSTEAKEVRFPGTDYKIYAENSECNGIEAMRTTSSRNETIGAISATVAIKTTTTTINNGNWFSDNLVLMICVGVAILAGTGCTIWFSKKNKKGEK